MRKTYAIAVLAAGIATFVAATTATGGSPGFKTAQGPMVDAVAPGAQAVHAFTTRQASVPAGVVTATAQATINGQAVTKTVDAAYAAASCR